MSRHYLALTHDKRYDDEPDYYQMLDLQEENARLRRAIEEVMPYVGDGRQVKILCRALQRDPPPLRKLKSKANKGKLVK